MRCCFIFVFFYHIIQSLEITAQDDKRNDDDYSKPVVRELSARYRALGCVNLCPAARGSQEAGFTQPREHFCPALYIFNSIYFTYI